MIRLREDIAIQLRRNARPVLVDCRGRTRIVAEDRWTWEFLRALDGAGSAAAVLARLADKGFVPKAGVAEVEGLLSGDCAPWLQTDEVMARGGAIERRSLAKLGELIEFARTNVPFYRKAYAAAPRAITDDVGLARLPLLTKDDLRTEFPTGLLAEGFDYGALVRAGEAEVLYSSGSTIDGDRSPSLHLVSEDDLNHDSPFGIYSATERHARFSTPRCTGRECYIQQQSREDRTFGSNLILNSSADPMSMSDTALRGVAGELAEWKPAVLSGNPWYLAVLLRFLEREAIDLPPSIVAVLFGTEFAPIPVTRYVNDRTGLVPFDNYSASEVGNIANTCPLGVHHVFDSVHVEVIRDGRPASPGELGEVVVSNLHRRAMPILRYRTGDLAVALPGCGCGLPHPALELHGRISECLVQGATFMTPRQLDQAVASVEGILFYRAHQVSDERISLEVCPRPDTRRAGTDIGADLREAVETLGFSVAAVKCLERMHARESMKFSTVVSTVRDRNQRVVEALRDA